MIINTRYNIAKDTLMINTEKETLKGGLRWSSHRAEQLRETGPLLRLLNIITELA
jgi:hypothetical protein